MPENRLEVQQTQKLSQNLQTTIHLLSCDLDELSDEIQKAVQENPALEFEPPKKSLEVSISVRTHYRSTRDGYGSFEPAAAAITKMEELEQQLRLSNLDDATEKAAMRILHMLSSRGYFQQELGRFAAEAGISPVVAWQALKAVQALEPAGIGARSLEECIELQLREKADVDPLCYELVRLYLADIGKGNLRQIARKTGAGIGRVQRCVDVIRNMTPSPCSLYEEEVHYIVPEFSVKLDDDGRLTVQFCNDYYPTLKLDERFSQLADELQGEERGFARRMQAAAKRMIQAVDLRQSTMEKLARIIVREQSGFFLKQCNVQPLKISEVSEEIGVHESTVYRAIQNKYLYCNNGTFALTYFFPKEVSEGTSSTSVKEMILRICGENQRLSDQAIAKELEARGIYVSRRTVTKYRAQMGIDSSYRRTTKE